MIQAVVFDLDGTLIDSTDAIVESNYHTFDALGVPRPARGDIIGDIGVPLEVHLEKHFGNDVETALRIYRAHYAETACPNTTLLPGARQMLATFAREGIALGFATSKKLSASELLLGYLDVLDYFTARIGPDEVAAPKPAPDALYAAAQSLEVGTDEMVFVGDMHFDVLAARRAKVCCLAVTTGYQTREELEALDPEAVFDGLAEVEDWVLAHRNALPAATTP